MLPSNNYISRIDTSTGVCRIYKDNIIGLSNDELGTILNLKYYEPDILSLFEHDRGIITDALILIHTWNEEHPNIITWKNYESYHEFFNDILHIIISNDQEIKSIARDLLESIHEMQSYLKPYTENFSDRVCKTRFALQLLAFALSYAQL